MHKWDKIDTGFVAAFVVAAALLVAKNSIVSTVGIAMVLTTMGAFIAYWGDIIGHHIGKKRLSHFNLRPRQTAVLWTIAAGGLSALLTFIILMAINSGFRTAVLRGTQLVRDNASLSQGYTRLTKAVEKAEKAVLLAKQAETAAEQRAQSAQVDEQKSIDELTATQAKLQTAGQNLKAALAEGDKLRAENASTRRQVIAEEAQVVSEQSKVTAEQAKLTSLLKKVKDAQNIYNPVMLLEQQNRLIYSNQQEVGRVVIKNDVSPKILEQLNHFLDRLGAEAAKQGAVNNPATGRAVKVATVEIMSSNPGHPPGTKYGEKENLEVLADQIHDFDEPSVVVVASAVGNSFDKGTVIVQLHPYVNSLVVAKGTVVASTVVSASETQPEQIMQRIQSMLVKQVRPYAIRQGVIPVQENSRDIAQLGDVPLAEIVQTIEEVQAIKGDAVISAFVPSDVYSADQLHLELSVKPLTSTTSFGANSQ